MPRGKKNEIVKCLIKTREGKKNGGGIGIKSKNKRTIEDSYKDGTF